MLRTETNTQSTVTQSALKNEQIELERDAERGSSEKKKKPVKLFLKLTQKQQCGQKEQKFISQLQTLCRSIHISHMMLSGVLGHTQSCIITLTTVLLLL